MRSRGAGPRDELTVGRGAGLVLPMVVPTDGRGAGPVLELTEGRVVVVVDDPTVGRVVVVPTEGRGAGPVLELTEGRGAGAVVVDVCVEELTDGRVVVLDEVETEGRGAGPVLELTEGRGRGAGAEYVEP